MVCLLVLGLGTQISNAKTSSKIEGAQEETILFSGFNPNTEIDYTILSAHNIIAKGESQADETGAIALNYNVPPFAMSHPNRSYNFKLTKNKHHINITFRHNRETGKMRVSGDGLDKFSDISMISSDQTSKLKADWAGAFVNEDIFKLESDKEYSYQIALHGFSGLADIQKQSNPAIIKVLSAPGGGLFSDTPNTGFVASGPSSGIYPLSTSSIAAVTTTSDIIINNYIRALMLMTEQLNAVVMQQTLSIGQFFDAKLQLEAQRTHQELKAEAVKDYHPSEQMCRMGSYVRSLANTEQKAAANKYALNTVMMDRYKSSLNSSSATPDIDFKARLHQYRTVYCNPKDNNNNLAFLCEHDQDENLSNSPVGAPVPGGSGGPDVERINKDIDYTRTMDFPNTLDMDMTDMASSADEEDVIALAKNLYWPKPLFYGSDDQKLAKLTTGYMESQRAIALNSIAHNSYTNIAAMKAKASAPTGTVEPGWTFMKTLMRDFGITDDEIEQLIGVEPSYWAQMEVLTKKIYQSPHFYTNLYDKPVNVDRIGVTLDAIKLMQMRDYYNSLQRREILSAALLETELVRANYYSKPESDIKNALSAAE